jgi:hypothetical protein
VDEGVGVVQLGGVVATGGDRDHAHAVVARAGDVAGRVADDDRPVGGPGPVVGQEGLAGPAAGGRGQEQPVLVVGAEAAADARVEPVADPGGPELHPRDPLEVAGDQGVHDVAAVRQRPQRLLEPGADVGLEVAGDVGLADPLAHRLGVVVDGRAVDARGGQDLAGDLPVGHPGHPLVAQELPVLQAVDLAERVPDRPRVRRRRAQQQGAVDVPEQQPGDGGAGRHPLRRRRARCAHRSRSTSAVRPCAKAAISFAAFWMSSTCAVSTTECM